MVRRKIKEITEKDYLKPENAILKLKKSGLRNQPRKKERKCRNEEQKEKARKPS
jgi:hypothetical protein